MSKISEYRPRLANDSLKNDWPRSYLAACKALATKSRLLLELRAAAHSQRCPRLRASTQASEHAIVALPHSRDVRERGHGRERPTRTHTQVYLLRAR